MAELKTQKNDASVADFIANVEPASRRADCERLIEIMSEITGDKPAMWGTSIVGFGSYRYVYASGRSGDWMITGFSPRKTALTCYIMAGFGRYNELMSKLGKYKTGSSCLYVKQLSDVDENVLKDLIRSSFIYMTKKYNS